MNTNFQGTGVAIVTPFHNYGTIDFSGLERLLHHVLDGGVNYIVSLGTTSEAPALTTDEKQAVMHFVKETVNGRVPVVMGIGGNSTHTVVGTIKNTDFDGVDAILSVTPYYNKPNQKGIYNHFKNVAAASPVPVILYNIPGRTASNIAAETTLQLAHDFKNIVAVKEASGDLAQVMEILRQKPKDFQVLSGDDALTFPMMTLGASGVISVLANVLPQPFTQMVNLLLQNKITKAREIHYSLLPVMQQLFADGNPAGIKAALEIKGIIKNNLRLPMVKANKAVYFALQKLLREF
ncbi:4-hydroxy-tetrahydrodipicolinate synthase [Candidatus Sulfidibacterium hydrothermale]|uniref:4-hydroxy-tetrahydrodipicolinate synthase n=1 Tax=Candidatus Sulfidibacterium hydrothermale TaxID=2875962 RepID=UPI001F0A43FD|nr:4-hydroxy-tetrahydrodipicolinate synthase [Candidatus Sulfidibacterium hydrothermale]UBM63198.1 4-hydroxy-tetrahydrodipicolinate synthase [Candidatus Sulfidibacterium hydrothermale]